MRKLRRCRQVYWAMDLYPDVLIAAGVSRPSGWATRLLLWLNRLQMRQADRVVALGGCMRELIVGQGVPPERVKIISVWSPHEPAAEVRDPQASSYRTEWGLEGRFVVQYSGNFGLAHDYETFCEALVLLRDHPEVMFLFAGGGKHNAAVKAFAERERVMNVRFKPYQPRERLGDLLTLADVHLISQSQRFTGIVVPSKLFGILAAGRVPLFVGPAEAEVARVLSDIDEGLRFAIGDATGLAAMIVQLSEDRQRSVTLGRKALAVASGPHHQRTRFAAWSDLLQEVTSTPTLAKATPRSSASAI